MAKQTFKNGFFDRDAVLRAIGKANVKIFNDYGRAVRKRAQKSLIYSKRPAKRGDPPHAHRSRLYAKKSRKTGIKKKPKAVSFLREFLYYKYDFTTKSVVIGPEKLNSTVDFRSLKALEYGGPSTIVDRGKKKLVQIHAHPFMHPAADAEKPGLPARWKNSVR